MHKGWVIDVEQLGDLGPYQSVGTVAVEDSDALVNLKYSHTQYLSCKYSLLLDSMVASAAVDESEPATVAVDTMLIRLL